MSEDFDAAGLFAISLSDSEDATATTSAEINGNNAAEKTTADRGAQSEEDFEAVRASYRVKVENGEIWKTIKLPLGPKVTKQEAQASLHAVEELYFFRRYEEAGKFARKVLDNSEGLDGDTTKTLKYYEKRCSDRIGGTGSTAQ